MTDDSRERLLRLLVGGAEPLEEIVANLRQFGWDSDQDLVVLTREHAGAVLDRYLRGEIDSSTVETWANAIEGREDIGYAPSSEDTLAEFVFEIANPDIAGALTPALATDWMRTLKNG